LLVSAVLALDPYRNLAVGAHILKTNFAATGDWPRAVGLYHTGSFDGSERRARAVRYVAGVSRRLSRHGLTLAQAATLTVKEPRHG
jgi:soluble lytic murein transglycosylase-like protein